MAERVGTVVVFKRGVSKEEAQALLDKIAEWTDASYHVGGKGPVARPFDDKDGGPVWYIP